MRKTVNPMTGDPMWIVDNTEKERLGEFVSKYYHPDFDVFYYDEKTGATMFANCTPKTLPAYFCEMVNKHGARLRTIGLNSFTDSYVVNVKL